MDAVGIAGIAIGQQLVLLIERVGVARRALARDEPVRRTRRGRCGHTSHQERARGDERRVDRAVAQTSSCPGAEAVTVSIAFTQTVARTGASSGSIAGTSARAGAAGWRRNDVRFGIGHRA
jgi:hypothetical protein